MNIRRLWRLHPDVRSLPAVAAELPHATAAAGPHPGCEAELAIPDTEASAALSKIPATPAAAGEAESAEVVLGRAGLKMSNSPETQFALDRMLAIP